MSERPILFSAPMIRAILEGRKTQTRRVVKHGACHYGSAGDRLWVRETWGKHRDFDHSSPIGVGLIGYRADERAGCPHSLINRWRPSIHMPRALSRISLEIIDIRRQRLQEITEEDAKSEGCSPFRAWAHGEANCRDGFIVLWNSINSKRGYGWQKNPEVWAISFKVIKPSLEYENESKKSEEQLYGSLAVHFTQAQSLGKNQTIYFKRPRSSRKAPKSAGNDARKRYEKGA